MARRACPRCTRRSCRPTSRRSGAGAVDAVVFVEANCAPAQSGRRGGVGRRAWRDAEPRIAGIVAFVDLLDETSRDAALDRARAHRRASSACATTSSSSRRVRASARVRARRAARSATSGLPFDLCITADQLAEVDRARGALSRHAASCSTTAASPRSATMRSSRGRSEPRATRGARPRLRASSRACSRRRAHDQRTRRCATRTLDRRARDCFGPARLLYGSDWPVRTLGGGARGSGASIIDAADARRGRSRIGGRSYADNAARFYGLDAARAWLSIAAASAPLAGRTAIVTGGGSGIGQAIATALRARAAHASACSIFGSADATRARRSRDAGGTAVRRRVRRLEAGRRSSRAFARGDASGSARSTCS